MEQIAALGSLRSLSGSFVVPLLASLASSSTSLVPLVGVEEELLVLVAGGLLSSLLLLVDVQVDLLLAVAGELVVDALCLAHSLVLGVVVLSESCGPGRSDFL